MPFATFVSIFLFFYFFTHVNYYSAGVGRPQSGPSRKPSLPRRVFAYGLAAFLWLVLPCVVEDFGYILLAVGAMETYIFIQPVQLRQVSANNRSANGEDNSAGCREKPVITPADIREREKRRLDSIVASGIIDDIIALCVDAVDSGTNETIALPRRLTNDDYSALVQYMERNKWSVRYSFCTSFTDSPKLTMTELVDACD